MGSKHQRRLAQTHNSTDRDLSPHYCSVCAVSATSAVHLQLHLNGRAHQRKAKLALESEADFPGSRHSPAALAQHGDVGRGFGLLRVVTVSRLCAGADDAPCAVMSACSAWQKPLLEIIPQVTELLCGSGHWETHRDGMSPGTISPHDHDSSRPNSGRSSSGSGRQHAEILPATANAHSSPDNHHDDAARSGETYM